MQIIPSFSNLKFSKITFLAIRKNLRKKLKKSLGTVHKQRHLTFTVKLRQILKTDKIIKMDGRSLTERREEFDPQFFAHKLASLVNDPYLNWLKLIFFLIKW